MFQQGFFRPFIFINIVGCSFILSMHVAFMGKVFAPISGEMVSRSARRVWLVPGPLEKKAPVGPAWLSQGWPSFFPAANSSARR